jgi:sec-independent protein translocase protein TatC
VKKRRGDSSEQQVVLDHVRELRTRLAICGAVLVVAGSIGYFFYTQIVAFLRSPLHSNLYYSTPAGSFGFIMKVSTMLGIMIALPVIIYNLIMFLRPAFKDVLTFRRVWTLTLMSIVLAFTGAAFGFYAILPGALKFFSGFQVSGLTALISADSYLSFVTNVIITFVLVFQIPLLMILFDRIKPIPPRTLMKMEKYVILAGVVVSILVPFAMDLVTCILIAAPIIVLYNLSVVMIISSHAVTKRRQVKTMVAMNRELSVDDIIIEEMLSIQAERTTVEAANIPIAAKMLAASPHKIRPGMDLKPMSRASLEEQRQAAIKVVEQRRELRRQSVVQPAHFHPISDMR